MFYTSIVINEDNIGIYAHGKLFWIYTAYAYLFLIGGVLVFLRTLFQLHSYYKTQIILLLWVCYFLSPAILFTFLILTRSPAWNGHPLHLSFPEFCWQSGSSDSNY